MNENQNTETGVSKIKPGKFWLWGLAVLQLPAVMLLTMFCVDETVVKMVGFAILLLCGGMDIKAVKKAGYQVPRWWWGMAVFLPPVYMICRVGKTDKAPSERVKRFAPVLVWVLLVGLLMGVASWVAVQEAGIQELDRRHMEREVLAAFAEDYVFDSDLTVDEVVDVSLSPQDNPHGFPQKWQATVKRSTAKGRPASAILRYDFERTAQGLEHSVIPEDESTLRELRKMAME